MADEGEFPKDDGDILFASEVNKFDQNIRYRASFGKTPTESGVWSPAPSTLTNLTDADNTTVTGTGVMTSAGGAIIEIDLGEDAAHSRVYSKTATWVASSGGGTSSIFIQTKKDGGSYVTVGTIDSDITETSEGTPIESSFTLAADNFVFRFIKIEISRDASDGNLSFKGWLLHAV